jgi:hypothetical protein
VENGVSVGDPDTDGVLFGDAFALELKCCARPARGSTRLRYHEVTLAQVIWHEHRQAAGGASGFLVQVGDGADARRYLVHGCYAQNLRAGVCENDLLAYGVIVRDAPDTIRRATALTKENHL